MSLAKEIFCNSSVEEQALELLASFRRTYGGLSLEDCLIAGSNWDRNKIENVFSTQFNALSDFFYSWDYANGHRQLRDFHLYDQRAIQNARHRAVFLQLIANYKPWHLEDMRARNYAMPIARLEELSFLSIDYPIITYAIKSYLLGNYSNEQIQTYHGVQPYTGPVDNFTRRMFAKFDTPIEHTRRCEQISKELENVSPSYVNSIMYLIG